MKFRKETKAENSKNSLKTEKIRMAQSFRTSFSPSLSNLSDASDRILRSTIEIYTALRLDEIDDGWVQDVWESQVNVNSLLLLLPFPTISYYYHSLLFS